MIDRRFRDEDCLMNQFNAQQFLIRMVHVKSKFLNNCNVKLQVVRKDVWKAVLGKELRGIYILGSKEIFKELS